MIYSPKKIELMLVKQKQKQHRVWIDPLRLKRAHFAIGSCEEFAKDALSTSLPNGPKSSNVRYLPQATNTIPNTETLNTPYLVTLDPWGVAHQLGTLLHGKYVL